MKNTTCRVCGAEFFPEPLLAYNNMPKAAQNMPAADELNDDKGVDLEVYQCSGCGLVQLSNEPVDYYKDVIRASAFSAEMEQFRKTQFKDFVAKYQLEGKKVLEAGCGKGEYLSLMAEQGIDAYGIENLSESVEFCRQSGMKVEEGYIDSPDYEIKSGPFDAFFIGNFFEHLPDPCATLRGICNNLTDDAIGLIEVPNFDMIIRENLFSEFISDHLFYFTQETLRTTLEANGFEMIECNEIWHKYIISAVVRRRKKTDLSIFEIYQEKIKTELNEFIDRFSPNEVAVWGAGHQALAVVALADIGDRVKYVVDSAPFKQGKFTPATHIPIVAPEFLNTDPVEAVIVMAAAYSDEVAGIVKTQYSKNIQLAVLRDYGLETIG
jgi:SAM-dependent methyltransferase